jgi:ComF family protein
MIFLKESFSFAMGQKYCFLLSLSSPKFNSVNRKITSLFRALHQVFFPLFCPGCGSVLAENERPLCFQCQLQLPWTHFHLLPENPMWEQVNKRARIQHATALFFFEPQSIVQSSIHALKYKGQETLGAYFGQLLGHCLKATVFCQCTAIVPVPLHPNRKKQRGYNQVMRFAESLSEVLGIPVKTTVIKRIKHTSSLALGSYKNRWESMATAFEALPETAATPQHWLLVDDVLTTGATITSCAKALLSFPHSKVSIATIAYRMS